MVRRLSPMIALLVFSSPALAQTTLDTTAPSQVANSPSTPEDAQDRGIHGLVALGGGMTTTYEGASSYSAIPFAVLAARWRGIEINLAGPELKLDFGGGGNFLFGPVIGLSNARSDDDMDGALKTLNEIENSASIGAFAGFRFGGNENGQGRFVVSAQATKDTRSEKGMSYDVGFSYAAIRQQRIFATVDVSARLNDGKYTRSFFGVTEAEAETSGLEAYRPGGGLNKVQGGITAGYQLNRKWGLMARISGGTFTGDAADSPIVRDGSKTFGQALLGVSYAF